MGQRAERQAFRNSLNAAQTLASRLSAVLGQMTPRYKTELNAICACTDNKAAIQELFDHTNGKVGDPGKLTTFGSRQIIVALLGHRRQRKRVIAADNQGRE